MDENTLIGTAIDLNQKKEYAQVIALLTDEVLQIHSSDKLYAEKSIAYYNLKKFGESKISAEKALEINPNNEKALNNVGNCYSDQKEYKKAEEFYLAVIQIDPNNSDALGGLGLLYYHQKDHKKAEESFLKALKINPNNGDAFGDLGLLYFDLNDYNKAEESYFKALDINPNNEIIHFNLGLLYYHQKDYKNAEESFLKALKINPNNGASLSVLGLIYYDQKDYKKAEESFLKALDINPNNEIIHFNLGLLYYNQKDFKKAEESFLKALKTNPNNSAAITVLGLIYFDLKDFKKAEKHLLKAFEIDPTTNNAYNLGLLYYFGIEPKDLIKSKQFFEKKIELSSSEPDLFATRAEEFLKEINAILKSPELNSVYEIVETIKTILVFDGDKFSHFTSLSAAKAMVIEKSPLRLSEATFLNDRSEGETLFKYVQFSSDVDFLNKDESSFVKKPFIGSYVPADKHNDLALWRLYGKEKGVEGNGCSLTFEKNIFLAAIKEQADKASQQIFDQEFQLFKVAYWDEQEGFIIDNKKHETLTDTMIKLKKALKALNSKPYKNDDEKMFEKKEVLKKLNEIAYLFKDKEYRYENEIRLVIKNPIAYEKKLEIKDDTLTPKVYIELIPIAKCITGISIGPKVADKESWAAYFHYYFEQLSKEDKMPKVDILVSTLPYR